MRHEAQEAVNRKSYCSQTVRLPGYSFPQSPATDTDDDEVRCIMNTFKL